MWTLNLWLITGQLVIVPTPEYRCKATADLVNRKIVEVVVTLQNGTRAKAEKAECKWKPQGDVEL